MASLAEQINIHTPQFTPQRLEAVQQELEEHGVAVLPGVLPEAICDDYIHQLHTWMDTFGKDGFPYTRNSLMHDYNIPHHPILWATRLATVPIFEALWKTKKLVSSIDGMALGQPPELSDESFFVDDKTKWKLHLDQGDKKPGLQAYQGAVYLEESLEDDWCFLVMDKSHLHHDEYFQIKEPRESLLKKEYSELTEKEITWYEEKGCKITRISAPKGGMVLWDSRTVHAGARPKKDRKNPGRWRYVIFSCMAPAHWALEEEIALKKSAFREMRCSRHWPAQGYELFTPRPVDPELNAVNELPPIALTRKVRLLAGDLQYEEDGEPNGPPRPVCHPL